MSNIDNTPDIMPLPALVSALSARCGVSETVAEAYVSAFTETITAALRNDNIVKIKGIGVFKTDNAGNILFETDPGLAAEINAPFSIFEPIEIDGSELPTEEEENLIVEAESEEAEPTEVPNEETSEEPDTPKPTTEETGVEGEIIEQVTGAEEASEEEPVDELVEENVAEDEPEEELTEIEEPIIETPVEEEPTTEAPATIEPETKEPEAEELEAEEPESEEPVIPLTESPEAEHVSEERYDNRFEPTPLEEPRVIKVVVREHPWLTGILAGIAGILVGFLAGYFLYPKINLNGAPGVEVTAGYVNVTQDTALRESTSGSDEKADSVCDEAEPAKADTTLIAKEEAVEEPAVPAAKQAVVYDTIRGSRYLTTMARQHYGRKIFWVYIYEENKAVISDPDNIAPNTVVVIPPAEKYGIKAGDKLSEQAAERKAIEILGNNR